MMCKLILLLPFVLVACGRDQEPKSKQQYPSPMAESTRTHVRVNEVDVSGVSLSLEGVLPVSVEVFVPRGVTPSSQTDILIHFHGVSYIPWTAVSGLDDPPILAVVNLGSGSSVYEGPFLEESTFSDLIRGILRLADVTPPDSLSENSVFLSAFSAGYGAVRAILGTHLDMVSGVLLLDGLHTDYVPDRVTLSEGGRLNESKMRDFVALAELAVQGEKKFLITHSEIFPGTYASTTETADYLLSKVGLRKRSVLEWGPGGMQLLSRADSSGLTILGFAGNTAPDHMDHLHNMYSFLKMIWE
ncbi:MAG: hypothetical protein BMS9Abin05_2186 [Rhodothermia bacterium]|nr:MAG: hypothetical protein BMS9Abin05_2186 [Rhodothermia bacterium]